MLKFVVLKFVAAALILVSLADSAAAQSRIRFARGKSSATLSGTLARDAVREFVINVRRNQTMTVRVVSGNSRVDLQITGRSGHIAWGDDGFAQIRTGYNGDHYIAIKNSGRSATRYTLTVTVR